MSDATFNPPVMVDMNSTEAAMHLGFGQILPLRSPRPNETIALGAVAEIPPAIEEAPPSVQVVAEGRPMHSAEYECFASRQLAQIAGVPHRLLANDQADGGLEALLAQLMTEMVSKIDMQSGLSFEEAFRRAKAWMNLFSMTNDMRNYLREQGLHTNPR